MSPINWSEICALDEYDENMTERVAHFQMYIELNIGYRR
jgi:hypothetical protein